MIFNLSKIEDISKNIIKSLKRFPMASLSAFIVTIIIITLMELNHNQLNTPIIIGSIKVAFVTSLGIVLFPALRLFSSNIIMVILGVAILAGYYYVLPHSIDNNIIIFRHIILILATFLILFWSPFAFIRISNKNIWEWTQNLILALSASIFFSILLYMGVSLALYAIERLFNIDIESKRYAQLGVAIFGIYGINLFLSQIPRYILLLQARTYTKAEVIFTKYILTSLTIGYFLIISVYSIKILVTGEWPTGIVAWISILFSVVAIITYLFWTPLWREENIRFKRAIWGAVFAQTIMLAISIWLRVQEYGITESRYFIALFGAWLILMSIYFIFRREASYKWLFITLTILLIGSQFGKYSAINVSRDNQILRLESMLKDFNSSNITKKRAENIYSTIRYLFIHHGIDSLKSVTPDIIKKYNDTNSSSYFPTFAIKELGIEDILNQNSNERVVIHIKKMRDIIDIEGYNKLINFKYDKYCTNKGNLYQELTFKIENNNLNILKDKEIIKNIDINKFIKKLKIKKAYNIIETEKMEYLDEKLGIKILFKSIIVDKNKIINLHAYILLK